MTCKACRKTFADLDGEEKSGTRALQLDTGHPSCQCEAFSVSEHSSGVVDDTEILVRILVAPQHMDKKGLPRAAALSDAERSGLSVFREKQATDEDIRKVARGLVERARLANPGRAGVFGVLRMLCRTIRGCQIGGEGKRCYCVYDTARKDINSHAEAFQCIAGVPDEVRDERRRKLFSEVRTAFIPVEEFRDGLLRDLAPSEGRRG